MKDNTAYKWFIDEMVEIAQTNISSDRIKQNGHAERINDDESMPLSETEQQRKELLLSLSRKDQLIIAAMLAEAQHSAVHNVCSFLEWGLSTEELKITSRKGEISDSPFDSMLFDFTGRLEGDAWPDEE